MKLPREIIIVGVLISIATTAAARLDETKEECAARYGKPVKSLGGETWMFSKGGINIGIHFHDGKADQIVYRKLETDAVNRPLELTENEIEILVQSNAKGAAWVAASGGSTSKVWQTDDSENYAIYNVLERFLTVFTNGFTERINAEKKDEAKENLKGF